MFGWWDAKAAIAGYGRQMFGWDEDDHHSYMVNEPAGENKLQLPQSKGKVST